MRLTLILLILSLVACNGLAIKPRVTKVPVVTETPAATPPVAEVELAHVCVVAETALNLRPTASTAEPPIATLLKGQRLTLLIDDGTWAYVLYGERAGFVRSIYVERCLP